METSPLIATILNQGSTYSDYFSEFQRYAEETDPESLDETARKQWDFIRLNLQRSNRVSKTYAPSEALREAVSQIEEPQIWMVLSENWCGDSAQILPQIVKMAELNDLVKLRILSRDSHPEIMDEYLTDGKRSIPKLVAFSEDGTELFQWGTRPAEAVEIFAAGLAAGEPKNAILAKLHGWYARNRGKAIDGEFTEALQKLAALSV